MNFLSRNILVDFDSTLNMLSVSQVDSVNKKFGTSFETKDITRWDWWHALPKEIGDYVWGSECFHNEEWTKSLPIAPLAAVTCRVLDELGYNLYLVSDRPAHHKNAIQFWLETHGIRDYFQDVILTTKDKTKGETKLQVAERLNLAYIIDDAPHHVHDFSNVSGVWSILFLDHAWNRDVEELKRRPARNVYLLGDIVFPEVRRMVDWRDILKQFV